MWKHDFAADTYIVDLIEIGYSNICRHIFSYANDIAELYHSQHETDVCGYMVTLCVGIYTWLKSSELKLTEKLTVVLYEVVHPCEKVIGVFSTQLFCDLFLLLF